METNKEKSSLKHLVRKVNNLGELVFGREEHGNRPYYAHHRYVKPVFTVQKET